MFSLPSRSAHQTIGKTKRWIIQWTSGRYPNRQSNGYLPIQQISGGQFRLTSGRQFGWHQAESSTDNAADIIVLWFSTGYLPNCLTNFLLKIRCIARYPPDFHQIVRWKSERHLKSFGRIQLEAGIREQDKNRQGLGNWNETGLEMTGIPAHVIIGHLRS